MAYNDKLQVIQEVEKALDDISFGSIELVLQDGKVDHITVKKIQKTGVQFGFNGQNHNEISPNSTRHSKAQIHVKIGA